MAVHPFLVRLLRKAGANEQGAPTSEAWSSILHLVDRAFRDADQDRYTLERSIDISSTEMQGLYESVRRNAATFRDLVENLPDPTFVQRMGESDFEILYANSALGRALGYATDELVGRRSIDAFVHPDDQPTLVEYRQQRTKTGQAPPLVLRWVCRDGSVRTFRGTTVRIRFDGHPAALVVARDITDEIARDRALRQSEARHREMFDGNPAPTWMFDSQTFQLLAVNDAMIETYGYTREELLAMRLHDLKEPADHAELERVRTREAGGIFRVGVRRHRAKDGRLLQMDITSHQIMLDGRRVSIAIGIDRTDALRLEEQLRQAQKMEAIGQLAGGVAHDFNNILAAILANAELAQDELGDPRALVEALSEIEAAAHRAASLTRQLLAFSRKQKLQPKRLALGSVVTSLQAMLRRLVGEDVVMTSQLAFDLGSIEADQGQLEQVIVNLVVNARDAMPQGGRLVIETACASLDDGHAARLGVPAGSYAALVVRDTGTGMSPDVQARIFDPFFTTKEVGKGTGLGLATVFGIVQQSRGGIEVESEVGKGTTFRVYLPIVAASATAAVERARAAPPDGTGTVLVVEDDEQVRHVVQRYLRTWGYQVLEARDGPSALALAGAHAGSIDLLLTDVVMPEMDGQTLANRMLELRPMTRVLYMSGYTDHPAVAGPFEADDFVHKPFTTAQLADAVKRALGPRPGMLRSVR